MNVGQRKKEKFETPTGIELMTSPGVWVVMGSIPVGSQIFFFFPGSCYIDQFIFHFSLPTLKFTIFFILNFIVSFLFYLFLWVA